MRTTRQLIRQFVRNYLVESAPRLNPNQASFYDHLYRRVENSISSGQIPDNERSKFLALKDQIDMYTKNILAGDAKRGSSRYVVEVEGDQVLKLAINAAGFAQNGTEAMIGADPEFDDVINIVTGKSSIQDYNGFLWITQKKIQPLSLNGSDATWEKFVESLRRAVKGDRNIVHDDNKTGVAIPKAAAEKRKQERRPTEFDALDNVDSRFFEKIADFIEKYKAAGTGDLYKPDSWGIDGGKLKLIDYGLTGNISKGFYQSLETGEDKAGKKQTALFYGGEKQAKQNMEAQRQKSTADKMARFENNADEVKKNSQMSSQEALFRLLQDVVPGLPKSIAQPTDLAAMAKVIRSRRDEIEEMISQLPDPQLKDKFYDGIDDYLLTTGELG